MNSSVSFEEYAETLSQNGKNETGLQNVMNEILAVRDQILSYSLTNPQDEADTEPPSIEIGVISDHSRYQYGNYYGNYDGYHNHYSGYDYGQNDYQRPDYDTQAYIKGTHTRSMIFYAIVSSKKVLEYVNIHE